MNNAYVLNFRASGTMLFSIAENCARYLISEYVESFRKFDLHLEFLKDDKIENFNLKDCSLKSLSVLIKKHRLTLYENDDSFFVDVEKKIIH